MEELEIDPWIKNELGAYETYSIEGSLYTIPFVISEDLTLTKSRDKYIAECRLLPREYTKIFEDKKTASLNLTQPVALDLKKKLKVYEKGSSCQHMSTILEGIEDAGVIFRDVDILVTIETLNKIAGAVFKREKSWKLRAHYELIQSQKMIVLCDDDLNEIDLNPQRASEFMTERAEALCFAQGLSEQDDKRVSNPFLHGSKVVISSLKYGSSKIRMVVVGEVDMMMAGQKSINTSVMTGRTNRVCFGNDENSVNKSFEYLWSRCFWLGMTSCLIGMRSSDTDPVKNAHRCDIKDFYHKHRGRIAYYPDVATTCVAQVLIRLREAVASRPLENWLVEYEGRPESMEQRFIKISMATDSRSFWLVREHFQLIKIDFAIRKAEEAARVARVAQETKKKQAPRQLRVVQQKDRNVMNIRGKRSFRKAIP